MKHAGDAALDDLKDVLGTIREHAQLRVSRPDERAALLATMASALNERTEAA